MRIHQILLERYINIFSPDQKSKMLDTIWPMLEQTYADVGGLMKTDKQNLIDTPGLWKIIKNNGIIVAGILYKDQTGRKLRLLFHDGTTEGKIAVKKLLHEDIFRQRAWGEFSGPLEKVLISLGANKIPASKAETLLGVKLKEIDPDGFHYTREVIPGMFKRQIILGDPELT